MSTNPRGRAWVEIEAGALRENYADIRQGVGPDARILPMVKADAYGLGVARVVEALEPENPWGYGVATVDEGLALTSLESGRPVVVMSPVPPDQIADAVRAGLHLSVSSLDTLAHARAEAERLGEPARVHVDVDTGMGRSGFDWRTSDEWLPEVTAPDDHVSLVGLHSHLHSADESLASVREQWDRLAPVGAATRGHAPEVCVHILNSAGAFRTPEYAAGLVRPGIYLYGGGIGPDQRAPRPVASVRARVVHVRDAEPGTTLGYGATYVAEESERWATLSIGYGDGLPRILGNRGSALLNGRRVPIVGRISMDVTVVDITGVSGVALGDVATLLGSDGDQTITLNALALEAGTISYEILTGLTGRLPRVWHEA